MIEASETRRGALREGETTELFVEGYFLGSGGKAGQRLRQFLMRLVTSLSIFWDKLVGGPTCTVCGQLAQPGK